MTQADAKSAVETAFRDQISKMFGMLVSNIETEEESLAVKQFETGLQFTLRAYQHAIAATEKLVKP